eukprot:3502407-Alexandrium_andersonii.AAC.1
MSASLVGSEMCIRDRPEAARAVGEWCVGSCGNRATTNHQQRTVAPCCACLLYTSDAADDM